MSYAFGKSSLRRAEGVNDILVKAAKMALSHSDTDMTIPWRGGLRTAKEQNELFKDGASRCDGYKIKSYHQSGDAIDIVPYTPGIGADYKATDRFLGFAKRMFAAFEFLQAIGQIPSNVYLHWGGFWSAKDNNNDGILHHIDDKMGWDKPHWELRDFPQENVYEIV